MRSRDVSIEAMGPIVFIFLLALIGGMLPTWMELAPKTEKYLFRYGNAIAAGVLAAAGFVHMFPDAVEALDGILSVDFPLAGFLALCGALLIFVMDNVVQSKAVQHHVTFDMHVPVYTMDISDTRTCGPTAVSTAERKDSLLTYVLFAALSVHSIFEGLAMGANVLHTSKFYTIFWAIMAHKFFAALALGISFTRNSRVIPLQKRVIISLTFAVMTPLGAILGVDLGYAFEDGSFSASLVRGSLTAFSSGIFIYVAFVEILVDEFLRHHHHDSKGHYSGSTTRNSTPMYGSSSRYEAVVDGATNCLTAGVEDQEAALSLKGGTRSAVDTDSDLDDHIFSRLAVVLLSASAMSLLALYV